MLHKISAVVDAFFASAHPSGTTPFFIKMCIFISVGSIICILAIILAIPLIKFIEKKYNRKITFATNHISKLLLSAVMLQAKVREEDLPKSNLTVDAFNKLDISSRVVKRLLIREMFNYRYNFSGKVADNIRRLYIMLSLQKEAVQRLYSRRWKVKVQAMSELFQMDIEADHARLLELLDDSNKYVRGYAHLSLIKFTTNDPLQFLRNQKNPISKWEEAEIFQLMRDKDNSDLSSVAELISDDKEHTVVSLSLKLAVHFKQTETIPFITELIKTSDMALRAEAITSLGKMYSIESEAHLLEIYYGQPSRIKLAILCALGDIQGEQSLPFLEREVVAANDFKIKKYASDALVRFYPASTEAIDRLLASGKTLTKKILRHSLDPLINQ